MTLKSYYSTLQDPKSALRNRIMQECNVSRETVYNWINGNTTPSQMEQEKIATIVNIPVEQLFPTILIER